MEQLSANERAVFVLREAFDFEHKEIAEAINISADNSRQLYKRAKEKVANLKHKSVSVQYPVSFTRYTTYRCYTIKADSNIATKIDVS